MQSRASCHSSPCWEEHSCCSGEEGTGPHCSFHANGIGERFEEGAWDPYRQLCVSDTPLLLPLFQRASCLTQPLWGRPCTSLRQYTSMTPPTMATLLAGEKTREGENWGEGWSARAQWVRDGGEQDDHRCCVWTRKRDPFPETSDEYHHGA